MTRVDFASISPAIPLGPLDGRYRAAAAPLVNHLSEAALNRARLEVEVEWLIHLTATGALPRSEEHTSELQSRGHLVCRLLLAKKYRSRRKRDSRRRTAASHDSY